MLIKYRKKIFLLLFLSSIVLFRMPYLYLLPSFPSAFLTTWAVARIFLMISLVGGMFFAGRNMNFSKDGKEISTLLLCFFAISSLSIFSAQNIDAFISRYKDFLIGIVAFYTFYFYRYEEKKIMLSLVISIPFMIVYQFVLLYGGILGEFIKTLIYQKQLDIVSYNLDRGRVYVDSYDEAFIPVMFQFLSNKSKKETIYSYILLSLLSFLAFISNFRTRIIMLAIGISSIMITTRNNHTRRLFFISMTVVFTIFITTSIAFAKYESFFFDRFFLQDNQQDVSSIYTRLDQIEVSLSMGLISPFGVGLGNYYDNLPNKVLKTMQPIPEGVMSARENIHNNLATVLAESGYIALFIFVLLLIKFIILDIKTMKDNSYNKRCFVIAFWSLFFFGLLNPPIPTSYQVLFWGMRGLLTK